MTTLADLIMGQIPQQQQTSIFADNSQGIYNPPTIEMPQSRLLVDFGNNTTQPFVSNNVGGDVYSNNWEPITKTSWLSDFGRNFNQGYNDNYNNRFNVENLAPDENKNWQTRVGEGLGTVGRFLDSPLGRGLITAGLVGATGGNGLQALTFGLGAGTNRKNMQTADRVYRKQLGQMGYTDQDLNNITGDITPQIYKGLADSLRLGNQRMTYGQLAMFDNEIAELLKTNPELENQFIPLTMARDIYTKRKDKAEADIEKTKADTEGSKARTEKTKAETGQVGKPRVSINIKQGGTHSVIEHKGGSGGSSGGKSTPAKPNRPVGQTIKEGTIIKNKQGKRMILRGGKWQPI